ncbi:MAG: isopentenyl-diphosphate Delta-isomerase [Gammaproteobacteria bacterium]|nr:isopentenyl-diphosphate Delta-isomerase [Gammaproteobacteria bacterium]
MPSASPAHFPRPPVSSEEDLLILVDADDREVGVLDKGRCHDGEGILHRAFSLFVFNPQGEVLLQQRNASKRLWGGYWSNSCCSHPRAGEPMDLAVNRRLHEELGITASLRFVYKFEYHARFAGIGSEHELCWVYVGETHDEPSPHPEEIAACRWLNRSALDTELAQEADRFTPWFRMEWAALRSRYSQQLPVA